jgi:hypothetical protein
LFHSIYGVGALLFDPASRYGAVSNHSSAHED